MTNNNVNIKQHLSYRDKNPIYFDILIAVKGSEPIRVCKTKLLYVTRLTSDQLKPYLEILLDNELLIRDTTKSKVIAAPKSGYRKPSTKGVTYHITEKGLQYLKIMEEITIPMA